MKNTIKPVLLAILSAYATQHIAFADEQKSLDLDKVEVISTTPLKGIGLPLEQVPAAVQTVKEKDLVEQKSLSLGDFINQNLTGVNINETQNNPYQPDVNFRGFTASPLLGTPQGLSVFVDGVRVNEPFGDVVNWDLIPMNSIQGMSLIPGSNPLFGLNTLGGALSVQTKTGRTSPGGAIEAYMGSWGRKAGNAEFGGKSADGSKDFFISANVFSEDGWRDFSPTDVNQVFGKVGWQNDRTSLSLSFTGADNKLVGNGLAPSELMQAQGYDSILTRPDITDNKMAFFNLNLSHYFSDDVQFSGNAFYRKAKTKTLNGDGNDNFDEDEVDANLGNNSGDFNSATELTLANAACSALDPDSDEYCSGAINRSSSRRSGMGLNGQFTFNQNWMGFKNQFITGGGVDYGRTRFKQSTEYGLVNATRGINGTGFMDADNAIELEGKTTTWSLFATDTLSLNPVWHLTASARYNHTKVDNDDKITPPGTVFVNGQDSTLTGTHKFNRVNPAIGVNFTPSKALTAYASYNEGSRAPTAIELGCANEQIGCRLPNAMAGDPPLDQVVTKTFEGGFRGNLTPEVNWSFSAYRSENHDDIQFISSSSTGAGFFDNVGKTRRQGFDAALNGKIDAFSWMVGYSFVKATYQSTLFLVNEVNSSAQDFIVDPDNNTEIRVDKGDYLAGIPKHQLKMRLGYDVNSSWNIGSNIFAFSNQYARGNENNQHTGKGGKIGGFAVVNLDTRYNFTNGWQLFGRLNNIFDREYSSGGMLGEHRFDVATGQFSGNEVNDIFYAPGAPRAGWFGARYVFGGKKSIANYDVD